MGTTLTEIVMRHDATRRWAGYSTEELARFLELIDTSAWNTPTATSTSLRAELEAEIERRRQQEAHSKLEPSDTGIDLADFDRDPWPDDRE